MLYSNRYFEHQQFIDEAPETSSFFPGYDDIDACDTIIQLVIAQAVELHLIFFHFSFSFFLEGCIKVVLSIASCWARWIIIICVTSFHKPPFHTSSYISPCFARGIPHFLVKLACFLFFLVTHYSIIPVS